MLDFKLSAGIIRLGSTDCVENFVLLDTCPLLQILSKFIFFTRLFSRCVSLVFNHEPFPAS